jgi:hypothetical protein
MIDPALSEKTLQLVPRLVAHDDAGHHAHAEAEGEDLLPVVEDRHEHAAPGDQPQRLQHGEVAGEPDREGREDDVQRHGERELEPGQHQRIEELHWHGSSIVSSCAPAQGRRSSGLGRRRPERIVPAVAVFGRLGTRVVGCVRRHENLRLRWFTRAS